VPDTARLDAGFLYHWLRANRSFLESLGAGATFKEISKTVVSRIEIPLPPLVEQKRIAAILDKADTLSRRRRESLHLTDELLKAVFIEMFVRNPDSETWTPREHLLDGRGNSRGNSHRPVWKPATSFGICGSRNCRAWHRQCRQESVRVGQAKVYYAPQSIDTHGYRLGE